MKKLATRSLIAVLLLAVTAAAQKAPPRDQVREMLRATLTRWGPSNGININFRQSDKQPYNFVGVLQTGLKNADAWEIVIGVTENGTISFRAYPHYKGGYVNLGRARDQMGLARKLLTLSNRNFLFWGADDSGDVFSGYSITLESGYPEEAVKVVLYSIRPLDGFLGDARPFIDGSTGVK